MRTLRAVVLLLLLVVIAAVAISYVNGTGWSRIPRLDRPAATGITGTSGTASVETARERGAEVGEKVAIAAAKVKESAAEATLTSKIKAKMVLDDNIRARAIDVTTSGSTVTLTGTVRSVDEHDRAVRLARETAGVIDIVDRLGVETK